MPSSTLIDVLRHGEPVGGARYRGITDDPLSEKGWQQMTDAIHFSSNNKSVPWTHVISSPLKRCADFATQLGETHELELHIEPRLTEIDFGDWEGLTSQQIMAVNPERLTQYWNDPNIVTPPNGEALANFKSRVTTAWNKLIIQHASTNKKHLLVVTHGGSLRMILSHVLNMPETALFNIDVPYACLSRFQHDSNKDSLQLIFHNGNLP